MPSPRETQVFEAVLAKLRAMSQEELIQLFSNHIHMSWDYVTTLYMVSDLTPEQLAAKIIESL